MNPKSFTIVTAFALFLGVIAILLKLPLQHSFFAIYTGMLFLLVVKRVVQGWTIADGSRKTNETLFEQEIAVVITTMMAAIAIGLTYILVNHVLDFQPPNSDCSSSDQFRQVFSVFECTQGPGKTAAEFWIFFSLIAIMWSIARRYMVRERWDDL